MVKNKRKAEEEKEKENQKENPSPNQQNVTGLQPQQLDAAESFGTPAPVIPMPAPQAVAGDGQVQVGLKDPGQTIQMTETVSPIERSLHPELGTVYQSNIVAYKGRKTRFLTIPKKLVEDELFPFKGTAKTMGVKITRTTDGKKLIVEGV